MPSLGKINRVVDLAGLDLYLIGPADTAGRPVRDPAASPAARVARRPAQFAAARIWRHIVRALIGWPDCRRRGACRHRPLSARTSAARVGSRGVTLGSIFRSFDLVVG